MTATHIHLFLLALFTVSNVICVDGRLHQRRLFRDQDRNPTNGQEDKSVHDDESIDSSSHEDNRWPRQTNQETHQHPNQELAVSDKVEKETETTMAVWTDEHLDEKQRDNRNAITFRRRTGENDNPISIKVCWIIISITDDVGKVTDEQRLWTPLRVRLPCAQDQER